MLVELACSCALAPAYHPAFFRRILDVQDGNDKLKFQNRAVVFILCGGVKISFEELEEYGREVEGAMKMTDHVWEVFCNGKRWELDSLLTDA